MKPTQASRCRIWSCACTLASVVSDPTYKRWPLPSMDCEWKRSSPRGTRFMRGLPRFTNDQEVNRLSLLPEVKPHQQDGDRPEVQRADARSSHVLQESSSTEASAATDGEHSPLLPRRIPPHGVVDCGGRGVCQQCPAACWRKCHPKENAPSKGDARARARCLT